MQPDRLPRAFKPRLDLTLVAFAIAGLAVATLLPARPPSAASGGRYALAISHGDDLKLAAAAGATVDPGARVLACRRVISVGPLDLGARCKPAEPATMGLIQTSAITD